jgi:hypothetical protein
LWQTAQRANTALPFTGSPAAKAWLDSMPTAINDAAAIFPYDINLPLRSGPYSVLIYNCNHGFSTYQNCPKRRIYAAFLRGSRGVKQAFWCFSRPLLMKERG